MNQGLGIGYVRGDSPGSDITGSGTAFYLPVFTAANSLGNSIVSQNLATATALTIAPNVASSGAITGFTYTAPANTGQTATSIPGIQFTTGSRQYAGSGIIATQYEFVISAPTYSAGGTTTITDAATLCVTAPTAGTNVTLTNQWAACLIGAVSITGIVATSGTRQGLVFTGAAHTGQTASTEINRILFTMASRQWATGAIATQREFVITSPTYSFVGASTITDAYSFYVSGPTAGTNATITNSYAAGFNGNVILVSGNLTLSSGFLNGLVRTFVGATSSNWIQGNMSIGTTTTPTARLEITDTIVNGGAKLGIQYNGAIHTSQTASTEISGVQLNNSGRQWATGNFATQREVLITAPTYSFVGASTITNAFTLYVSGPPIAGTNATISNTYALGLNGALRILAGGFVMDDALDIYLGSTTGTKLGTNASQKLGFWNATPIVQPTTGVAAATFVANTSLIANDTATFDGYTIGQVVKALRNAGLLA